MTNSDKKPNYLLWIMLGIGILVLLLGIGLYLLWRKMSSSEIKAATSSKTLEDMRVATVKLESELKAKDEKIQELVKDTGELRNKSTELSYQLKQIKKDKKPIQHTGFQSGTVNTQARIGKSKKQSCDDGSCTTDVEDLE